MEPNTRVRLAGVEQCPDPVVLEVAESESDALDPLDEVVEGLGRPVGHPGQVEVADLVEPGANGVPDLWTSGGMARLTQWALRSSSIALATSGPLVP